MKKLTEKTLNFFLPRWEKLPDIDLYLDQIVTLLMEYLEPFITDKEEKIITKTMINNYVKSGVLKPPVKKKYTKTHLATLIVLCLLKQVYSINDVKELIRLALGVASIDISYNKFCNILEKSIECIFENKDYIDDEDIGKARRLLKCATQSYANKLYVEKTFLNK